MLPLHSRLLSRSGHALIGTDFRNDAYRFQLALHAAIALPCSCLRLERPYLRRNLASFAQAAVHVAFGFGSAAMVIGWSAEALPELLETVGRIRRPDRDRSVIDIKLRRRAAIIDPPHLPCELAKIAGGLGRNKQRDVVAMPGQRDIARGAAPMLAVIEVGLIERAPLPLVDRPGIAVPELAEFAGLLIGAGDKRDQPLLLAGFAVKATVTRPSSSMRRIVPTAPLTMPARRSSARAEVPVNWIRSFSAKGRAPSAVCST